MHTRMEPIAGVRDAPPSSLSRETKMALNFEYAPLGERLAADPATSDREHLVSAPRGPRRRAFVPFLGLWALETAGLIVAAGTMVAMIIVLARANNGLPQDYPYGITLNGIIAILSTVSKGGILATVGLCLGQLKWNRFMHAGSGRPLIEFKAIEQASRGPLGSLRALPFVLRMPVVLVGLFVMIVSIGFDFAVQQIVAYVPQPVQVTGGLGRTVVPRADIFNYTTVGNQGGLLLSWETGRVVELSGPCELTRDSRTHTGDLCPNDRPDLYYRQWGGW